MDRDIYPLINEVRMWIDAVSQIGVQSCASKFSYGNRKGIPVETAWTTILFVSGKYSRKNDPYTLIVLEKKRKLIAGIDFLFSLLCCDSSHEISKHICLGN